MRLRATLCTALLVAVGCGPPDLRRALPERPGVNVLIITFDALRADHLGAYGYDRPVSPRLDAFAERAVVFESARVGGQATPTSFASAFTGFYPHRVFRKWKLDAPATLAGVFQRAGYRTGAFLHNIQLVRKRGFDAGFENFRVMPFAPEDKFTEVPLGWLRQHVGVTGEADPRPFLLWVHYISPHEPYKYVESAAHLYSPGYRGIYVESSKVNVTPEAES